MKTKEIPKLITIIESIENKRIGKSTKFEQFKIGKVVKYNNEFGIVISISPHKTSLIVEFKNGKKSRFSLNKRAKNVTVDSLSLHKLLKETK
jgi:hypothetical protein